MAGLQQVNLWNTEFLVRRIDRCYLIAAGARRPEKRARHHERARFYRRVLARILARFS